jgi:hypothetical protein
MLLCVGLAVAVGVLAGCGGAGNPGGNNLAVTAAGVTPQALDPAMVGTWMLVSGTSNGVVVPPKNVTGWDPGMVRELVVLLANGTCTDTCYNASGGVVKKQNGTWSATGGTGSIHWPSGTSPFTYTFQGANVSTWTSTIGGAKTATWAKIVTPTAHDAALVKTWTATGVWLNGASKPLSYLTGNTTYAHYAMNFLADGTSQRYFLGLDDNQQIKLPKPGVENWATGGGVLKLGTGPIAEQIYTVTASQLTTWQLDAAGNTLKIVFKPYGMAGAHDARIVGTWHPVSGKIDGVTKPIAVVMNWKPGITSEKDIFRSDGTYEYATYAGTTIGQSELDRWYTTSGTIHLDVIGMVVSASYVFVSGSWTGSFTVGGHTKVVVFAKDS